MTILIVYVTFVFASLKLMHLLSHHNPQVNESVEIDAFGPDYIYETATGDFMLAVAVEDYLTGEIKHDPRFVKWFAEHIDSVNGVSTSTEVPMHICTEEDYERFYTPDHKSADWLERTKKKGGMMCINWIDDSVSFSNYETDPKFQSLDIMYLPCTQRLI